MEREERKDIAASATAGVAAGATAGGLAGGGGIGIAIAGTAIGVSPLAVVAIPAAVAGLATYGLCKAFRKRR